MTPTFTRRPGRRRTRPLDTADAIRAFAHPLRVAIVADLRDGAASPVDLSRRLDGANVQLTAYHVRILRDAGVVALDGTRPRRGAIEHRYALTPAGLRAADAVEAMKAAL